jgi:hypothetical protein
MEVGGGKRGERAEVSMQQVGEQKAEGSIV